jgi:CubicO group peptidase (beta-lactamase class C family)
LCYTHKLPFTLNYGQQGHRFRVAYEVLQEAINARAFPAASVAVLSHDELIALRGFGRHTYDPSSPPVSAETIFDLASVSKVVATTTAAAILFERGLLHLDSTVPGRDDLTIRGLLTHTSGLPAYVKLFERTRDRGELLELAYATPLEAAPGTRTEYSDIGFIILGDVLETLVGNPLDRFCQHEIFHPLELRDTRFNPDAEIRFKIAPTRDDHYFRNKLIQGEVNDENAWVMNGVAGHAGVFSTAYDVALFAQCWLAGGAPILKPETVAEFTRQQPGSTRALGWDRPTPPSGSGRYFSSSSFGHLGYTGTSLWCDPEKQLAIVLLTNRTWPDASNQAIKQIRPRFHDAIIEAL